MKILRMFLGNRLALLLAGSAVLLCACDGEAETENTSVETLMTEYSENRTVTVTENGRKSYCFTTPLLEGYTAGKEPYREFRKGVKIVTYYKDSSDVVDVTLTANYAIYYENRKLWEAKGNVVVIKSDGKELYTEQLFWNNITKKIYSNVDSKIVEPEGEFFVTGFESDEEFRYWSSREMDGHMEVEFSPTAPEQPDSLAADSLTQPQKRPAPQPKTSPAKRVTTPSGSSKSAAGSGGKRTPTLRKPAGAPKAKKPAADGPRNEGTPDGETAVQPSLFGGGDLPRGPMLPGAGAEE